MSTSLKSGIDSFVISKVRKKRLELNISQSELATHLDVSNGFIGQVESTNSPTKYSLEQLNAIALIFKCSIKDFIPDAPISK